MKNISFATNTVNSYGNHNTTKTIIMEEKFMIKKEVIDTIYEENGRLVLHGFEGMSTNVYIRKDASLVTICPTTKNVAEGAWIEKVEIVDGRFDCDFLKEKIRNSPQRCMCFIENSKVYYEFRPDTLITLQDILEKY